MSMRKKLTEFISGKSLKKTNQVQKLPSSLQPRSSLNTTKNKSKKPKSTEEKLISVRKNLKKSGLKIVDLVDSLPVHATKKPSKQGRIKRIILHTSDLMISEEELSVYDINPNHISRTGCPTGTYHYTVRQSGEVFRCVSHRNITWHAGPFNASSLAVALIYKTDREYERAVARKKKTDTEARKTTSPDNLPSKNMLQSTYRLLAHLCLEEGVPPNEIYGHRELKGTGWTLEKGSKRLRKTCPGMSINLNWVREIISRYVQQALKEEGYYLGRVDGLFGPKSISALSNYRKAFYNTRHD